MQGETRSGRGVVLLLAGVLCASAVYADEDPALQWLLEKKATTAPAAATQPAETPTTLPSPLVKKTAPAASRLAEITLSNGSALTCPVSTTADKPLRVWVEAAHEYRDIPLESIARIEASVVWERLEKEWHFIASGSDLKEYTGRTYPARETAHTLTLKDGTSITGGIVAPIYILLPDGQQKTYVLHKRDKGQPGQTLEELVYIKTIVFKD